MNIKNWITHPLSVLWSTSKDISTIENRQFLYNQENALNKMLSNQEWIWNSINHLIQGSENQVNSILNYQKTTEEYMGAQLDIATNSYWGINSGISNIYSKLEELDENQIKAFKMNMEALGVVNESVNMWFSNLLMWVEKQGNILMEISYSIDEVIDTLKSPRKIEWLELKKDGITYMQKGWYSEALEYLNIAAEKLTTDEDVYYYLGLLHFEINEDYNLAQKYLIDAIKYSKWNNNSKINILALSKLASVLFVAEGNKLNNWEEENITTCFNLQLEAIEKNNYIDQLHIYNLLKYASILEKYDFFEEYLYILLKENKSLILEIYSELLFTSNQKILNIIDKVIFKIKREDDRIELLRTKEFIEAIQNDIDKLEKENYIEGYAMHIDSKIIIIWNSKREVTEILKYWNNDIEKLIIPNIWECKFKYISVYENENNTIYWLSNTNELNWENEAIVQLFDSNLNIYGKLHQWKINIRKITNDSDSIYVSDRRKSISWGISKYNLPNNTKASSLHKVKEIINKDWKINFLTSDRIALIYWNEFTELIKKYKELDNFIEQHIFLKFNYLWKGKIKFGGKIFSIYRKKNIYGYQDYKIDC